MRFEHLVEINDPLNPLIPSLTREQVWSGLMLRVDEPTVFLPGLERCEILSRTADQVERRLHFGGVQVRDTVTFSPLEWVRFESSANAEHAGGRLTIRLEQPELHIAYLLCYGLALRVYEALEAHRPGRKLNTNVEFYSAVVMEGVGLPADLFTPTFAVSRTAGWTAHILEQVADNRLIRPDAEYIGPPERPLPTLQPA